MYHFKNTSAQLTSDQLASVASYASGVGINYAALNTDFSNSLASKDLLLHVYTVNSFEEGLDAYGMGADGIFTNTLKEFKPTD
ncbi:hypothetical protein ACFP65_01125 [Marinilactibacillus sp. GCM10026970]|uniref:hypothetical protein n=1 Tax=Marinilactibacillus sp. GCM10026970 TaxID=3252642 RepID=UPI0036063538